MKDTLICLVSYVFHVTVFLTIFRSGFVEMDSEGSDQGASAEVTPASSENDLQANKSEGSVEEDEEEDDADIDKMLNELASFQEASLCFYSVVSVCDSWQA